MRAGINVSSVPWKIAMRGGDVARGELAQA